MYTAGVNEGHTMHVCDLEFQGQPSRSRGLFSTFLIFLTSKMLESTPKINFVSCLPPEIWKVVQKVVWRWFSRSCNTDGIFFIITVGFLDPENIPMRNISEKFGREDQNPGEEVPTPLGVRRWIFTLGICGLNAERDEYVYTKKMFLAQYNQLFSSAILNSFCRMTRLFEHCFYVITWIRSYLTDRSSFVKIDSSSSPSTTILTGVAHDSILGLLLFFFFISPVANVINSDQSNQITLCPSISNYADDTQLYILYRY